MSVCWNANVGLRLQTCRKLSISLHRRRTLIALCRHRAYFIVPNWLESPPHFQAASQRSRWCRYSTTSAAAAAAARLVGRYGVCRRSTENWQQFNNDARSGNFVCGPIPSVLHCYVLRDIHTALSFIIPLFLAIGELQLGLMIRTVHNICI